MVSFRSIGSLRLSVAVILVLMTGLLARFPARNGDLPFYIAAAYSARGMDDSAALAAAATEIAASLPATDAAWPLQNLGAAPPRYLDFYRIKTGYIWSVLWLHRLGFSFVDATVIPSLAAFFILGWVIFLWCARLFDRTVAVLFWMLLLAVTGVFQIGRISTPDAVSQCLLFGAIYRVQFCRSVPATLFCLFLSLFFRLDNLPAVAGLLILIYAVTPDGIKTGAIRWVPLLTALATAILCCVLINAWSEPRFWWFRPVPYPGVVENPDPRQEIHYLLALARGPVPVLLVMAAVFSRLPSPSRQTLGLLIFLGSMIPVRYLLFPHYEDRFFVSFFLSGFCLLAGQLAGRMRPDGRAPEQAT